MGSSTFVISSLENLMLLSLLVCHLDVKVENVSILKIYHVQSRGEQIKIKR